MLPLWEQAKHSRAAASCAHSKRFAKTPATHKPRVPNSSWRCFSAVLFLLAALLLCVQARAQDPAASFDAANKLYEQGKYSEAVAAYQQLLQSGRASAAIYFNLGNAFFKSGQLGRALAAYRQAEQLAPRDPDLRANLQFARGQIAGPTLPPGRFERWLGRLTVNEWTGLAAAALWLWLLLLAALQLRPALKPLLKGYILPLGLGAGVLCACFGAALYHARFAPEAIVVARDIAVRQSPFDEAQATFTAHDGAEVRILDQKDGWFQVSAGPRQSGWLRREHLLQPGRS